MRTNTTKKSLSEGKVVFGAIISRYSPDQVELFGAIGFDFVMIDCEHGPMNLDQVEHMVRAAESFNITPNHSKSFKNQSKINNKSIKITQNHSKSFKIN